ncbi:MAG TPA: DoxX family membrane protein, partial [Acidimicrobiales bacterium]|nr:DoxX family membrane protein [Acidimicrobiales bacterium]
MTATSVLARPMLAGMFVYGGIEALRDPKSRVLPAESIAPLIARQLGLPEDTELLVRINGGVQVAAGLMLATGKFPRLASAVLATSLVPTTLAGHRFWEEDDPSKRHTQQVQFLKNTAMLGGLLLATADTGGRASLPWQARRQMRRAARKAARKAAKGAAAAHLTADAAHAVAAGAKSATTTGGAAAKGAATPGAHLARAAVAVVPELARAATSGAGQLGDRVTPTINQWGERVTQLGERVGPTVSAVGERVGPAVTQLGERVGPAVAQLGERVGPTVSAVGERVGPTVSAVGERVS